MTAGTGGSRRSAGSGLQPERTALAWQRTTLGLLANGGLFALRSAAGVRTASAIVLVAALLVLSFGASILGWRRERTLSRPPVRQVRPLVEVRLLGWSVVAVCAAASVVLALPGG